jgi:hypothetical protein
MRFFPSIPAAIMMGAIWMPLFVWGTHLIERRFGSGLVEAAWGFVGFVIPVLLCTTDVREMVRGWRRFGFFSSLGHAREQYPDSFRRFLVPAWLRMGVWFASTVVAVLLLRLIGVHL